MTKPVSRVARLACWAATLLIGGPLLGQTGTESPAPPKLTFAFELRAQVGPPTEIGQVPHGRRRIVPILGGTVKGPQLNATVLPGGADWQLIQPDGFSELDTRYTLETDKGERVYVQNAGIRHAAPDVMQKLLAGETVDPKLVYFRTVPKFETAVPELQWLARSVFVGIGERFPTEVVVRFYRLE
ncbi:MAG TPA: DUF3237 domain-containing protein [Gammaproteobacteria bacterium]